MAFSSGVKLGDLDDFISAAQDCVVPLIQAAGGGGSAKLDATADGLRNLVPRTGASAPATEAPLVQRPNLIKSKKSETNPKAEIGQVSLSDCLACSGCVTSAETVLLQAQSVEEFMRRVKEAPITVVTISPEARASIAAQSGGEPLATHLRLAAALRELGVEYVLETSAAEAIALLESTEEFVRRFKKTPATPGAQSLPLLTSHCPGWTCYAEKVVDPAILPHVHPVRPPQQIQGRLVKSVMLEEHNKRRFHRWWRSRSPLFAAESAVWLKGLLSAGDGGSSSSSSRGWAGAVPLSAADVYHVAVQPCFDRKIESSRPQFEMSAGVREVDTVLTATELLELVSRARGGEDEAPQADEGLAALREFAPCPPDSEVVTDVLLQRWQPGRPLLCGVGGHAESGGFAEFVFREAARQLFQKELPGPLDFCTKQNEDMREVELKDAKGKVLLKFVAAYGFRNIQNVIRKVTRSSSQGTGECGHFIEIMACPGGCINGGGQVPVPKLAVPPPGSPADVVKAHTEAARVDRRQRLDQLEALVRSGHGVEVVAPERHPLVLPIYNAIARLAASQKGQAQAQASLPSLVGSQAVRSWLEAKWRSLKIDDDGKAVVGAAALKW